MRDSRICSGTRVKDKRNNGKYTRRIEWLFFVFFFSIGRNRFSNRLETRKSQQKNVQ